MLQSTTDFEGFCLVDDLRFAIVLKPNRKDGMAQSGARK